MGTWKARAAAAAVGLGLCIGLIAAAPAMGAEPGGIAGRVVEAEETEPVGGTIVCAEPASVPAPPTCVEADGSGAYEIAGLEPGKYRLHFQPPAASRYVPQYFLHTQLLARARLVEVFANDVRHGFGAALEAGGWVTGRVSDPAGNALSQVTVCISNLLIPELEPQCVETGVEGKYEVLQLAPGPYTAAFSAPEERSIFPLEREEFFIEGYNETPDVDAQLELGATIAGSITEAGSGAPLAGIRACALSPASETEIRCALSDKGGHYAIHGLHARGYVVGFSITRSEGGIASEPDDGFVRQYFEDKPTFAAANVIDASVPGLYGDVDAHLSRGPEVFPRPPAPPASTPPAPTPPPKLHCRKHFRKKLVKGKRRCVRVHRHRPRRQ